MYPKVFLQSPIWPRICFVLYFLNSFSPCTESQKTPALEVKGLLACPVLFVPLSQVVRVRPNDKDAKMKYQECNKIVKQKAFERAIASDELKRSVVDSLDIENMSESSPASGSPLERWCVCVCVYLRVVSFSVGKRVWMTHIKNNICGSGRAVKKFSWSWWQACEVSLSAYQTKK